MKFSAKQRDGLVFITGFGLGVATVSSSELPLLILGLVVSAIGALFLYLSDRK